MDKTLESLSFDMELIKGYIINNVADIQNTINKLFVIDQMINHDEFQPFMGNGITLEVSSLLLDQYKCPNDLFQCPSSGDCIQEEKLCDGYPDCSEGLDEDPKKVITNCCDEFILSGVDSLSAFWYHKYMGTYEKVRCARYVSIQNNIVVMNFKLGLNTKFRLISRSIFRCIKLPFYIN